MPTSDQILGVILAGGRSRRFGGGDKGLADLGGQSILARVIAQFRPQVGRLVLNINGDPERFSEYDLEIVSDNENPELGPLSGLLAVMDWAAQHGSKCTAIATVSADVPFLPNDVVARLDARREDGVAIAMSGDRRHPTIAIWPMSTRQAIAEALKARALSVDKLAARLKAVAVAFPMRDIRNATVDPFFNINTPDDLSTARALLAGPTEG
ncbi:molybdenum cofactor guanylyltransferase MobA [Hyphomicrobium sp.]|uniref:molybdenum cofactor guanylyltransferase MobA n=1 Tax=Hyphomicrobium sp. TaxID=82 RepID=UPI000FB719CD|nr:molybdenum cofactor guanylyltransferase MobA [Hyphomicrobium sp.]RUP07779.1 MAG: molybdenum cofactor guanylyltransferase MobA [Hyphomicrobium sp.]